MLKNFFFIFQPQFSSTPAAVDTASGYVSSTVPLHPQLPLRASSLPAQRQRHVLGPLGSQENIIGRQQVLFKGGKKTTPSPLAEHARVAKTAAGGSPPSDTKG